ncbi:MAG: hypothetical protein LBP98_07225 [Tannerella sp.]|jgi:hypothetical protein|nr:hypothetical protein [Tannerella sp.]
MHPFPTGISYIYFARHGFVHSGNEAKLLSLLDLLGLLGLLGLLSLGGTELHRTGHAQNHTVHSINVTFTSRLPAVVSSHGGADVRKIVLDVTVFKIITAVFVLITAAFKINAAVIRINTTVFNSNATVFKTNTEVMTLNTAMMKTNTVALKANDVVFILNTVALTGIYCRPVSSAKVITC